ncbi:MAG: NAD-dependent epimerase/dehydratase family protein [Hyphomonadaceae bacterium]|nr:NAD-dependent epimerase/dehydratase family protein [Hyphomonadaceae bacterium]
MKCLVVGGTGFLGGAIVETLLRDGDEVTVLSRGKTNRKLPDAVKIISTDRFGDLSQLQGRHFDWVFDTCAFEPVAVSRLLERVGKSCQRYVLISSISAYGTFSKPDLNEHDPVPDATPEDLALADGLTEDERGSAISYGESYGRLKRACEQTAEQILGDRATILRVGLLIGAGDYTDRLTWWVRRLDQAKGDRKRVPAPAPPGRKVQMIDVYDVADFALKCAQAKSPGIWNVTGTPQPLSAVLDTIIQASGSEAELVWVSQKSILEARISPWTDIPLMAPAIPAFRYFLEVSTQKAEQNGLVCRPLSETLNRLIGWDRAHRDRALTAGMTAQQEALLLG